MEAFNLTEGPEVQVRTYNPEYRFTFKWTIEHFSKIPINTKVKSSEFSVDPQSKWYGEFRRSEKCLYLFLHRYAEMSSVIDYSALIRDCNGKILYQSQEEYTFIPTDIYRRNVLSGVSNCMSIINSAPNHKIEFTVFLKVLLLPHKTVDVSNFPLTFDLQQKRLETLSRDLKNMLDNSTDADVTLIVQGENMPVHKNILCARSSVFARMFQPGMAENEDNVVHIEDISLPTMKALVSFMYSGQLVDYDFDTALNVYYAADKYSIMDLRDICGRNLVSKLTLDIASEVLTLADKHRDLVLRDNVMKYIAYHYIVQE